MATSDYMAKAIDTSDIDHGDAVHYKPENELTDADIGYPGELQDSLNNRFQFDTGDSNTVFAGLLEIDFHYETDRPGSREEYVK